MTYTLTRTNQGVWKDRDWLTKNCFPKVSQIENIETFAPYLGFEKLPYLFRCHHKRAHFAIAFMYR